MLLGLFGLVLIGFLNTVTIDPSSDEVGRRIRELLPLGARIGLVFRALADVVLRDWVKEVRILWDNFEVFLRDAVFT
jgi:hypothetical protein